MLNHMEATKIPTPVRAIETVDLTAPEHQHEAEFLERAVTELIVWIETSATHDQKMLLASADIFSVFIGLVPEVSVYDKEVKTIFDLLQNPRFSEDFLLLKSKTHSSYSVINISQAKRMIMQYRDSVHSFTGFDETFDKSRFEDWLIQVFTAASPKENELMYGLLSGFPLTAAEAWRDSRDRTVTFLYEKAKPQKFPPARRVAPRNYHPKIFSEPPSYSYSPLFSQDDPSRIVVPPFTTNGLPGSGFRFGEQSIDDPDLQKYYARFNFVFQALGVAEYLQSLARSESSIESAREPDQKTRLQQIIKALRVHFKRQRNFAKKN
jgi:hypothetical protein